MTIETVTPAVVEPQVLAPETVISPATIVEPVVPSSEPVVDPVIPAVVEPVVPVAVDEDYDLELSPDSPLSEAELNEIAEYAGANNLTKEEATKLITKSEAAYNKGKSNVEAAHQEVQLKQYQEIMADPMFLGEELAKTQVSMRRVLETFGDAELNALMNTPEIGNNIHIARFLKRIGDTMSSETVPPGKGHVPSATDDSNNHLKKAYPAFYKEK